MRIELGTVTLGEKKAFISHLSFSADECGASGEVAEGEVGFGELSLCIPSPTKTIPSQG